MLGRPLADFFRNISFANRNLDRDICALNHPLSPACPFQENKRRGTTTPGSNYFLPSNLFTRTLLALSHPLG